MKPVQWLMIFLTLKSIISVEVQKMELCTKLTVEDSMDNNAGDYEKEDSVVSTKSGPVRGHVETGTPGIKRFYDIPYGSFSAENPFEEPSPSEPWEKVHDETKHKSRCPQIEYPNKFSGDTDCLTLSIMTPTDATKGEQKDVLFHIHDASFNNGSGNPSIYGPEFIVPKGIILVLPNYRLGALGFLCLQNATVSGNAALKDLTLALKWVKDNIAAFGGNPSNIVVSGEGSGGALVGYLAVSPMSREYVSKVIAESGFLLSHRALDRDPVTTVENLLRKLENPIDIITSKSDKFMFSNIGVLLAAAENMNFAPCIENGNKSFITETPWNILINLKTNMSYMIGAANQAGLQEALEHTEGSLSELNKDFGIILPNDLDFNYNPKKRSEIGNRIRVQYFGNDKVTLDTMEDLSLYYTDASYLGPMIRAARPLVAAGASVYFYEFAFVGNLNQKVSSTTKINGATRGDIARYIFCYDGKIPDDNSKEKHMVDVITELWKNFIHTGKPVAKGVEWPRLEQTAEVNENWLMIGAEVKPQKGLHIDRLKLWTEIYDTYFVDDHNGASGTCPYIYTFMLTFFIFNLISNL